MFPEEVVQGTSRICSWNEGILAGDSEQGVIVHVSIVDSAIASPVTVIRKARDRLRSG
jgi:hypothetical protein